MLHAAMRGTRSQADPGLQGIMVTHFAFRDAYPNQAPSARRAGASEAGTDGAAHSMAR
jgi:hypothetical protein